MSLFWWSRVQICSGLSCLFTYQGLTASYVCACSLSELCPGYFRNLLPLAQSISSVSTLPSTSYHLLPCLVHLCSESAFWLLLYCLQAWTGDNRHTPSFGILCPQSSGTQLFYWLFSALLPHLQKSPGNSITAIPSKVPFFLFCSLVQFLTSCSYPFPLVLWRRWFTNQFYRRENGGPKNLRSMSRLHSQLSESQEWNPAYLWSSLGWTHTSGTWLCVIAMGIHARPPWCDGVLMTQGWAHADLSVPSVALANWNSLVRCLPSGFLCAY